MRKKILFLLLSLLMTGSAFADCLMYIDDFTVMPDQMGTEIELCIKADFSARLSTWQLDLVYPEGITPVNAELGSDGYISYLNSRGRTETHTPSFYTATDYSQLLAYATEAGYWYNPDEGGYTPYGVVKWEGGSYDEMVILRVQVSADFKGGEIIMNTTCTSDTDTRGGTIRDNGDQAVTFTHVCNVSYVSVPEAYAYYTSDNTTLTFYYDDLRSTRWTYYTYDLNEGSDYPDWINQYVTRVVFDSSFSDARPTTTCRWFDSMYYLQSITGMEYLNTSEVTNMVSMFNDCTRLTSVDLSHFNTAQVTDMSYMFHDCNKLTSLDLSSFNTAQVTDMSSMFTFCSSLTKLDLSSFNTAQVTDMTSMFYYCKGLTKLDLSSFNTAQVSDMTSMFYCCTGLTTIYAGDGWNTAWVWYSNDMFYGCSQLVGGQGTTYDANHVNKAYAHIDGGPSNPGYFSEKPEPEAYACFSFSDDYNTTLTFYYDDQRSSREGPYDKTYDLPTGNDLPEWEAEDDINSWVNNVVFDPSFSAARPTTTRGWFEYMSFLRSITGMKEYLNTSEVTDMSYMFYHCNRLTSVDLSGFNTERVTTMERMFSGIGVTNLDLSSFNTAAVDTMIYMFSRCDSLTTLDLSSFNTAAVKRMTYMFERCNRLKTIYVGDEWSTASVAYSPGIFQNCTSLVGGMGTTYDANHTGVEYAHIDGGPSNPGYFTEKVDFLRGDVNGNGQVNTGDLSALISLLLGGGDLPDSADCNLDGNKNIGDVPALINFLLTGTW